MAYREPEATVRVELSPPGFWLRLRIELRGTAIAAKALWAMPAAIGLTAIAMWSYQERPPVIVGFFITVFLVFFLVRAVPPIVSAALRATTASPLELGLPRAFVFRASGLRIEPADTEAYERRWPYFHEARRTLRGLELVLSFEPYSVFPVRRSSLRKKDFAQLVSWLVDNKLLRR